MSKTIDLLLPLGSVVKLKDGIAMFIIQGYLPNDLKNPDKYYDYEANLFPIGREADKTYLFNEEDIDEVMFIGYQTKNSIEYRELIEKVKNNLKNGMSLTDAIENAKDNKEG